MRSFLSRSRDTLTRMIVKVLIAFVLAVGVFCMVAVLQPPTYHVERTIAIAAPPARVFALIDDFHGWSAWSPWAKIDPAMKLDIGGPPQGAGSTYAWSGNKEAGAGSMVIQQSDPNNLVGIHLEFTKPYVSTSELAFKLKPQGAGTVVTWIMDGENGFMLKAMSLFSSMDKIVGPDFDKGLAQLKSAAEKDQQ